jgi:Dehydrogenase E1 component
MGTDPSFLNLSPTDTVVTRAFHYYKCIYTGFLKIFHSMSDPGTTYRTRDEIQRMRSTQDPIKGLQKYLEEWGVTTEEELKVGNPQSLLHFTTQD